MQVFKRFILLSLYIGSCYGASDFHDVISYNIGMSNVSITENESSIEQTDDSVASQEDEEASASAISAMSFQLTWEFKNDGDISYFTRALVPFMASGGTGVFSGDVGFNMYLNDLGTKYTYTQNGNKMVIIPKFKYYWGASGGVGYMVYATESATKSDIFFNLGFHGGGVYSFGDSWGIKGEVGAGRTTGVATTGIKIDVYFGATYYL